MSFQVNGRTLHRYTVDSVGRIYTDHEDLWLPSVTTVLSMKPTPEPLKNWKKNTDNWEAITKYKQNRGTLIHYECQNPLIDEEIWSSDEQSSEDYIKETGQWERYEREREWALEKWELIRSVYGITPETVLDIETYTLNTDVGYAGQFDILYQDQETNETVLCDLKTSKDIYDKFPLQLSSYAHAVDISIDRAEVIRMNPDNDDWFRSTSHDWERPLEDYYAEFIGYRRQFEEERMDAVLAHIQDLIERNEITKEQQPA